MMQLKKMYIGKLPRLKNWDPKVDCDKWKPYATCDYDRIASAPLPSPLLRPSTPLSSLLSPFVLSLPSHLHPSLFPSKEAPTLWLLAGASIM